MKTFQSTITIMSPWTRRAALWRLVPAVLLIFVGTTPTQTEAQTGTETPTPMATISVETKPLGRRIPQDFVGLSLEVSTAGQGLPAFKGSRSTDGSLRSQPMETQYALGHPGAPNLVFFQLMRNFGAGVLRLGGNSQDNSCWDQEKAPHPEWCQAALDAGDFRLFSEAARASGWQLIVGLNLKQNGPDWARQEVADGIAPNIEPSFVRGLEIGNEPDLFSPGPGRPKDHSPADHVKDFLSYVHAFAQDPVAKQYAIAGPATCCEWRNPRDLGVFLDAVKPVTPVLATVHEYPATVCGGRTVTVEQLLAPALMARFRDQARPLVAAARERNLPIALAETNSASCGGMPGVSNSFASALWGLDWMFSNAEDGFSGINFHISYRPGGSSYNPVDTVGSPNGAQQWRYWNTAQPLYYAMYMFARNAPGNYLLPASIVTGANIRAYAVSRCAGCATKVFVINKDLKAAGNVRVQVAGTAGPGSLLLLQAPGLTSTAPDVRYGSVQFGEDGHLPAPSSTKLQPDAHHGYVFALPAASAALLSVGASKE